MAKTTTGPGEPDDQPDGDGAPVKLTLDANSFNAAERMECQVHFDAPFGDLLACIYEAVAPRTKNNPQAIIRIEDRDGNRAFPDQIIQFMLWVQTKRDDPDVELSAFDGMVIDELEGVHLRGLVGKARSRASGKSGKPSTEAGSADSSG